MVAGQRALLTQPVIEVVVFRVVAPVEPADGRQHVADKIPERGNVQAAVVVARIVLV